MYELKVCGRGMEMWASDQHKKRNQLTLVHIRKDGHRSFICTNACRCVLLTLPYSNSTPSPNRLAYVLPISSEGREALLKCLPMISHHPGYALVQYLPMPSRKDYDLVCYLPKTLCHSRLLPRKVVRMPGAILRVFRPWLFNGSL